MKNSSLRIKKLHDLLMQDVAGGITFPGEGQGLATLNCGRVPSGLVKFTVGEPREGGGPAGLGVFGELAVSC